MPTNEIWFQEVKRSPSCSNEQLKALGDLFLNLLENSESALLKTSFLLEDSFPRIVFVSISQNLKMAKIYCGTGLGLIEALKNSYDQFKHSLKEINPDFFKIDVVRKARDLRKVEKTARVDLQYTLEGLAFSSKAHFALLPEQIFAHNLFNDTTKLINYENMYEALNLEPMASTHLARLMKGKVVRLFAFKTSSLLVREKNVQFLFRGNVIRKEITGETLKLSLKKAANYLARAVNATGKFNYIFKPDINYYPLEYNITRHAGTLYAMFEYCEFFPNQAVLNAGKRGLDFLLQKILAEDNSDSLCVLENGIASLGSSALSAVALQKYIQVTKDKTYLPILIGLGNFIVGKLQETGEFKPTKEFYLKEITLKVNPSRYAPGEAVLALLRIYSTDNNLKWLKAAEKAIYWLITVRDKIIPDFFHDHWLTYALNEIYQYRKENIYLEHARKICHSTLTQQTTDSPYPDWNGGYGRNPRSTPAATRGEGLYAAYSLFKQYGKDKEFLQTIQDVYRQLVLFELSTQFLEESTLYFSNPIDALGGFQGAHTSTEIRIDYVQHNMSSLLGYYKLFLKEQD